MFVLKAAETPPDSRAMEVALVKDLQQDASLEKKRYMELCRQGRVFNARNRIIGVRYRGGGWVGRQCLEGTFIPKYEVCLGRLEKPYPRQQWPSGSQWEPAFAFLLFCLAQFSHSSRWQMPWLPELGPGGGRPWRVHHVVKETMP